MFDMVVVVASLVSAVYEGIPVCRALLQCVVAVCCRVLQCDAECCSALQPWMMFDLVVVVASLVSAVYEGLPVCSALQCVAVRCRVLQSVAVRCRVLQCVAVFCRCVCYLCGV